MGKIYYLDLLTLVESLQVDAAILSTQLPKGAPGLAEPCMGYVRIQQGRITDWRIEGRSGKKISGQQVLQFLQTIQQWQVELQQGTPGESTNRDRSSVLSQNPTQYSPALGPAEYIPRPVAPLHTHTLQNYSTRDRMLLRMVYTMIDDQRTIQQIKGQLHLPTQTI